MTQILVASGSVSLANMRLSAVNGAAFVDFSLAKVLGPYIGCHLYVYDHLSAAIDGYIKAAGTGEGFGDELLSSWTNHATFPYETFVSSGSDITSAINTAGGFGIAYASVATDVGGLYKFVSTFTLVSGSVNPGIILGSSNIASNPSIVLQSDPQTGNKSLYCTSPGINADYLVLYTIDSLASNFSAVINSFKQVTAPSATGVTIVSAQNGTVQNWTNNAGIDSNDALGFTYAIYATDTGIDRIMKNRRRL